VWDDHIWYDGAPSPSWSGFQEVDSSGTLHLRTNRNFLYTGCSANCYPINTITTQTSGKTFQYGYFEVRMKWPAGHGSWPGFWLYSYQHAIDSAQCTTQAGEVDVMEGQGSEPDVFYGTVHSNTNGCAPADDQNGNNYQPQGVDLSTGFHTYSVQWTPSTVTWYLDGVETHSAPTYPTDNQPMFLLLQEWVGGWTFDTDSTTSDTLDNQIDYVDVWQQ
jgi:beta-glucanase (GH16 family)